MNIETLTADQAWKVMQLDEGQFLDFKSKRISPSTLTKTMSAFANSEGGELYVGVEEQHTVFAERTWDGFSSVEAANGHIQAMEKLFPLGSDFQYEFLTSQSQPGLLLHVVINKTLPIKTASNNIPYLRRGAQNLPVSDADGLKRLEYAKGLTTFEAELVNVLLDTIIDSAVTERFITDVVPSSAPEPWLRKQALVRGDRPTVAGVLLFSDLPQALMPKHCGIKVYRYRTADVEGTRETLVGNPDTIEGCLYEQIHSAVKLATEIAERTPRMGATDLEPIQYPPETLHEIITNAVIHRDYSIADDVHVRVFDNRVEVQSPGRLPAHVTIHNILEERFARNGAIVRILNKFPDPPNRDVGEGLNTAFNAMIKLGLKQPSITEGENSVLVVIRHEPLASAEESIMDYLAEHESIKNKEARLLTHVNDSDHMKVTLRNMEKAGLIEKVPGTAFGGTRYRMKQRSE